MIREPVLIVGRDTSDVVVLAQSLSDTFRVFVAGSLAGAARSAKEYSPRAVLYRTDCRTAGAARALVLLREAVGDGPELVVMSPEIDEHFVLAMRKANVYDCVSEPFDQSQLSTVMREAIEEARKPTSFRARPFARSALSMTFSAAQVPAQRPIALTMRMQNM
jgi:DNA-binding NtrC family response regulator